MYRLPKVDFFQAEVLAAWMFAMIGLAMGASAFESSPETSIIPMAGYPAVLAATLAAPMGLLRMPIWARALITTPLLLAAATGWLFGMSQCDIRRNDTCVSNGCKGLEWQLAMADEGVFPTPGIHDSTRPLLTVVCGLQIPSRKSPTTVSNSRL